MPVESCGVFHRPSRTSVGAMLLALTLVSCAHTSSCAQTTTPAVTADESRLDTLVVHLSDAVRLGLQHNEQLAQARLQIERATGDFVEARAGRLPQLSLSAGYGYNLKKPVFFVPEGFGSDSGHTSVEMGRDQDLQAAATITWDLFTFGRLSAAVGATRHLIDASVYLEGAVRDAVAHAVQISYYACQLTDENLAIAESALAMATEAHRVAEAGHAEGTISRFDLLRAEVEVANREPQVVAARNDRDQALLQLRRLCGLAASRPLILADSLTSVPAPAGEGELLARLRDDSPELQALHAKTRAAEQNLALARAGRWPVLQAGAQYALQSEWDNGVFPESDERATSAAVTLGLSWPIFDGLATKGRSQRAAAELRIASEELDRVTNDRELGVRAARMQLLNALTALEGRREAVELAEEAYRLAEVRLVNGLATPLERLDAELALTTARGQYVEVLFACNRARADLDLAVGGAAAGYPDTNTTSEDSS